MGKGEQTACEYRTAHDVTLLPLQVVEAQYYTRELASLEVPGYLEAKAGIRIRLQCTAGLTLGEVNLKKLSLFLRGGEQVPVRIYEQMPEPKFVVAVGTCACSGGVFKGCYNVKGGIDAVIPVSAYIPGCPARPEAIIDGVVKLLTSLQK